MKPNEMTVLDMVLLHREAYTLAKSFDHEAAKSFDDLAHRIQVAMPHGELLTNYFPTFLQPFVIDAASELLIQFGPIPDKDMIDLPACACWEDICQGGGDDEE